MQDCLKSSQTLQDLAQAVADAWGPRGPVVVAAAAHAQTRMGRRLATHNQQLYAVFSDLKDAVGALAESARTGVHSNADIDRLLGRI